MARTSKDAETILKKDNMTDIAPTGKIGTFGGMTKDELMNGLRLMYTARSIDNKVMKLLKQGKAYFHIAGAGHEATQVAFGLAMEKKVDWGYPYYRDMAYMIALGMKKEDIFLHMELWMSNNHKYYDFTPGFTIVEEYPVCPWSILLRVSFKDLFSIRAF